MDNYNHISEELIHQLATSFKWTFFFVTPVLLNLIKFIHYMFPAMIETNPGEFMQKNIFSPVLSRDTEDKH